jgi:hypothetical protein
MYNVEQRGVLVGLMVGSQGEWSRERPPTASSEQASATVEVPPTGAGNSTGPEAGTPPSAGRATSGEPRVPEMRRPIGCDERPGNSQKAARPPRSEGHRSPIRLFPAARAERAAPTASAPAATTFEGRSRITTGAGAHAALQASFLDNRIDSHRWETWGFRLVPDVKKRLEARLAKDKQSSDNRRLAQGHYVDAAMCQLPGTMEERLRMIREFLVARGGYTAPGKPSNYRVSQAVWQVARKLDTEITAAAKRGLVVFLFSAVVERFLDRLDSEGPLELYGSPPSWPSPAAGQGSARAE